MPVRVRSRVTPDVAGAVGTEVVSRGACFALPPRSRTPIPKSESDEQPAPRVIFKSGHAEALSEDWLDLRRQVIASAALGPDELGPTRVRFDLPTQAQNEYVNAAIEDVVVQAMTDL